MINVKKNLLNEAIVSKEEKLKDIRATLEKLQKQNNRTVKSKDDKATLPQPEPAEAVELEPQHDIADAPTEEKTVD